MPTDLLTQTFTRLRPRLKALADRLLQSQDDAEDALQEAFYRLWKRQSDDEAKIDAVRVEGLAVTTVRNLCLDNLRHASAHPQWSLDDEETHVMPVAAPDKEEEREREETLAEVTSVIESSLTERQRTVLYMRDRDGYEMEEIAEQLGLSEANVRTILSRSRKVVRETYMNYTRQRI